MKIVFVGPDDSARAPMAAAIARKALSASDIIYSVGLNPGQLDVSAVQVMQEIGIDISDHEPSHIDADYLEGADYIVFVSLKKGNIRTPNSKQIVWPIPDPAIPDTIKDNLLDQFRDTRTALEKHVLAFSKLLKD